MRIGDRIPDLNLKMKNHSEQKLKSMKFHRTLENPELFYIKFPVVRGSSGKALLTGKVVVSTINGEVKSYLYGQIGELYPSFFEKNPNVDSYMFKVNTLYLSIIEKYGIKEIKNEKMGKE